MACSCGSSRIATISGKTSDLFCYKLPGMADYKEGYVRDDMGIGGGEYVEFDYCLDCGKIQGKFPVNPASTEEDQQDW